MLEAIAGLIKTLPTWLYHVVEILTVAILFGAAVTLLAGIWIGIFIVKRRAKSIESFTLIPFRIEFKVPDNNAWKDTQLPKQD